MEELPSVTRFRHELIRGGRSRRLAQEAVGALQMHAANCRVRSDLPNPDGPASGIFYRRFVVRACEMTRRFSLVSAFNTASHEETRERAAACEALHDLIMDGV